jgi:hypothetical protein
MKEDRLRDLENLVSLMREYLADEEINTNKTKKTIKQMKLVCDDIKKTKERYVNSYEVIINYKIIT